VAIANALQLGPPDATPVLFRFNYDFLPSVKSLNHLLAFLLPIHYFTL